VSKDGVERRGDGRQGDTRQVGDAEVRHGNYGTF